MKTMMTPIENNDNAAEEDIFFGSVEALQLCFCDAFSSDLPVTVYLTISDLCSFFSFVVWHEES
jgi:hypothetical protein